MFTITQVNTYTFSGSVASKYQQAIVDAIRYMGWMSLKNSDHAVSGPNPVSTRRVLKEAVETRKAADALLASGAVVLLGTWSNGIAVGPGEGFVPVSHANVTPIIAAALDEEYAPVAAKKSKSAGMMVEWTDGTLLSWNATARRFPNLVKSGASCDWQPGAMHGPAYVPPLGTPPGYVGIVLAQVAPAQPERAPMWLDGANLVINPAFVASVNAYRAAHPEDTRFAQRPAVAPDPIEAIIRAEIAERPAQATTARPSPMQGDTVHLTYRHENGTTTERIVEVKCVLPFGFRGYDRTYRKVRNFYSDHIAALERWEGEGEDIAAG